MRAGAVLIVMRGAAAPQFYILRKLVEAEWGRKGYNHKHAYIASLSAHTIVYKGQLMPSQARPRPACCALRLGTCYLHDRRTGGCHARDGNPGSSL